MKAEWITDNEILAMDSVFYIDGRLNYYNAMLRAIEVKNSYLKNFPHKYNLMNRFKYKGVIIGLC